MTPHAFGVTVPRVQPAGVQDLGPADHVYVLFLGVVGVYHLVLFDEYVVAST